MHKAISAQVRPSDLFQCVNGKFSTSGATSQEGGRKFRCTSSIMIEYVLAAPGDSP